MNLEIVNFLEFTSKSEVLEIVKEEVSKQIE